MVKVGDKVVVVSAEKYDTACAGDVLTVWKVEHDLGFWAKSLDGLPSYVKTEDMEGISKTIVRPYTETEAEKRGAKFGVTGVVKSTGDRVVFVKERNGVWRVFDENGMDYDFDPSEISLDHEPEYVAWSDAPERLRYDASRVYCEGELVKWIAKPEGAWSNVAFVNYYGVVQGNPDDLTVKL